MFHAMVLSCRQRLIDATKLAAGCRPGSETHRLMMQGVFALEDAYFTLLELAGDEIAAIGKFNAPSKAGNSIQSFGDKLRGRP